MKKLLFAGALLVLLICSTAVNAGLVNVCDGSFKVIVEAKEDNGQYSSADTFDSNDNVYVWGSGVAGFPNVYVTADRNWNNGDAITPYVLKKESAAINGTYYNLGKFAPGKYDVIVDRNKNGIYEQNCDGVDSATVLGFEVLPELATLGLLGLGLVSMTGYFSLKRKK